MKFSELANGVPFVFDYEVKWATQTHLTVRIRDAKHPDNDFLRKIKLWDYETGRLKRRFPTLPVFYKTGETSYRQASWAINLSTGASQVIKIGGLCSGYVIPDAEVRKLEANIESHNFREMLGIDL